MSEFCLECWNKIMDTKDTKRKFIMSRDLDLCEECGQWKHVIVAIKPRYLLKECFDDLILAWNERNNRERDK